MEIFSSGLFWFYILPAGLLMLSALLVTCLGETDNERVEGMTALCYTAIPFVNLFGYLAIVMVAIELFTRTRRGL